MRQIKALAAAMDRIIAWQDRQGEMKEREKFKRRWKRQRETGSEINDGRNKA